MIPLIAEIFLTGRSLRDEINDEDLVENGEKDFDESLVSFVGNVGFQARFVLKAYDEAMSVALGVIFRADIGAPLEIGDGVDLLFERGELALDFFDLLRLGVVLELETDDVAIGSGGFFFGGGSFFVVIGHGENRNKGGESDDEFFHGRQCGAVRVISLGKR